MLKVTCAIIEKEGLVLGAQRSESMSLPLKWEFPGGKLELGEDPSDCIVREIREELNLEIRILDQAPSVLHEVRIDLQMELIPFVCSLEGGVLEVREHNAIKWCSPMELEGLDWAVADLAVLDWWKKYRV